MVIALNLFGLLDFTKGMVFKVTQPVIGLSSFSVLKVKGYFSTLFSIKRQLDESRDLKTQVKRLQKLNADLLIAQQENSSLRKLLALKQQLPHTTVAASVVSRDSTGLSGSVVINRGRDQSISPGDAVIDESGALMGVVSEVYTDTSKFILITDGSIKIDARVPNKPSALGVVTGSHGLGLSLDLISQEVALSEGDMVATSGLTGKYPAGLVIGELFKQPGKESDLFQRLAVKPSADFKNFQFVLVITAF